MYGQQAAGLIGRFVTSDLRRRGFSIPRLRRLLSVLRDIFRVRLYEAIGDDGPRLVASKATSRTVSQGLLDAARSSAWRATLTRDLESIRKWRCAVSIRTLSVWVPKKS